MKILHVIPGLTFEQGGTAVAAHALACGQAALGHEVTLLTTNSGLSAGHQVLPLSSAVRKVETAVRGSNKIAYSPQFSAIVTDCLRACEIAHIHSVFNYPSHIALKRAAAARTPAVVSPHGMLQKVMMHRSKLSGLKKRIYLLGFGKLLRRACTAWHYTSANEQQASWPVPRGPAFVQGLGVDLNENACPRSRARTSVARRWPALGGAPFILFLGRLHPKKKPKFLVDAFLNAAPQHYRLVMAGPDEMGQWSAIEESLRTRSAMHRVVATGPVSGAAKAELYSAATLFALPSINENFGLTVLEALSAGTPVLSSPHVDLAADAAAAGLAETLPLDSSLWEERLARLPASEPAETEFASRARAWVAASYSWDRISARFIERYGWVLEGRT